MARGSLGVLVVSTREERRNRPAVSGIAREELVAKIKATPSAHEFVRKPDNFEAFKADPESPGRIFNLLTNSKDEWPRMALSRAAKEFGMPKGAFVEWFTSEHAQLYESALRVVAADLAVKAMEAAIDATPEDVAVKKLQAETALKIAARFDRARYGEQSVNVKQAVIVADAGLQGLASSLLERLAAPVEKVVNPEDA